MDEENGRKDRVKALFAKIEGEPPEWHDFTDINIDATHTPGGPEEVSFRSLVKEEEFVKQLSGLSRDDFVVIQERLLETVQSRVDRGDRDKAGSVIKKRRPSTSQSFYTNGATTNGRVSTSTTFLSLATRLTKIALRRLEVLHRRSRGPCLPLRRTCCHPSRLPDLRLRPPWSQKSNLSRFIFRPRRRTPFSTR